MNRVEHLLACLAEECGEVAKECHKALRFGLNDQVTLDPHGPRGTTGPTNRGKIQAELNDLLAVVGMCVDEGILSPMWDEALQRKKRFRVVSYMEYAQRVGALDQPPHTTANDGQPSSTAPSAASAA